MADEILAPVPRRHVVFSIPKGIGPDFRYDRKLGSILFSPAWNTLSELAQLSAPVLSLERF